MLYYIICLLIGFLIGICILLPKLKINQEINNNIINENKQNIIIKENLEKEILKLKEDLDERIKYNEEYLENQSSLLDLKLKNKEQELREFFKNEETKYREEYLIVLKEYTKNFKQKSIEEENNLKQLQEQKELFDLLIGKLRSAASAAVEANKREMEKLSSQDFYCLMLSEQDIQEIKKLREILPYLRDKEPLNKVIYKVYYEKPYLDLVGRVVGKDKKTGIYKITNITNGMCYVGQAVDIAERWKQHIRRGVGADAPTNNKLYPIMYALGPENFTFEILQECKREELNSLEDYWQDFFHAKDFGYSIK